MDETCFKNLGADLKGKKDEWLTVVGSEVFVPQPCPTPPLYAPDSPGKNAGLDCHALLQWILRTQGSDPGLLIAGRFSTA